jgi:hypothetical protein
VSSNSKRTRSSLAPETIELNYPAENLYFIEKLDLEEVNTVEILDSTWQSTQWSILDSTWQSTQWQSTSKETAFSSKPGMKQASQLKST